MALMYIRLSELQSQTNGQLDYLRRSESYLQAALRDFRHYQGRAAADEAKVQRLLDPIAQELQALAG